VRYIIETGVLDNVEVGIDAIRTLAKQPELDQMAVRFNKGGDWFVKETKTGYSAKQVEFTHDESNEESN